MSKQVLILMGSDSDLGFMSAALKCLKEFEVGYEVAVCSVHRSPEKALGLAAVVLGLRIRNPAGFVLYLLAGTLLFFGGDP